MVIVNLIEDSIGIGFLTSCKSDDLEVKGCSFQETDRVGSD